MLVKNISFPISLSHIEDIYDDNIDVFVDLENGSSYTVVVATWLMDFLIPIQISLLVLFDKSNTN